MLHPKERRWLVAPSSCRPASRDRRCLLLCLHLLWPFANGMSSCCHLLRDVLTTISNQSWRLLSGKDGGDSPHRQGQASVRNSVRRRSDCVCGSGQANDLARLLRTAVYHSALVSQSTVHLCITLQVLLVKRNIQHIIRYVMPNFDPQASKNHAMLCVQFIGNCSQTINVAEM